MRKLATIQKIYDIKPIPEKDRICSGKILGWNVIIGKDSFIENDLVVFCEIDSVFPQTATWSDLERVKYRIKTMKVNTPDGPVYGQGYCIPISKLEELVGPDVIKDLREGDEVTELLGITKYEAPDPSNNSMLSGYTAGKFPTDYIHKTDETRLASCFRILDEMNEQECVIRMKIDGCLSGDTLIQTQDGLLSIEDIFLSRKEFLVKSFNINTHEIEYKKITNKFLKENIDNWYEIELENGKKIKITGNHKVWLPQYNCYREVSKLKEEDILFLS